MSNSNRNIILLEEYCCTEKYLKYRYLKNTVAIQLHKGPAFPFALWVQQSVAEGAAEGPHCLVQRVGGVG